MCAQVICEVPDNCCGDVAPACDVSCEPRSDPCPVPEAFPPCAGASGDCNYDYSRCCYQQPPRTQPIRPITNIIASRAPMETDTIYKRSYYANCGDCYRPKPVKPCNTLRSNKAPMETCTVQKLSYMPPCATIRATPIKPVENGLGFSGNLSAMTSQKHDYVQKGYSKREPIRPVNAIWKVCAPLESCTVNRLSYMPVDVCQHPPPKPILQSFNYVRPTGPSERCTIQKLSYQPVCLPGKEPMPWAEKVRCAPPEYENLCTTYNLSYMPNCNPERSAPILPMSGLKMLGTDAGDGNTVYKLSYMPVDGHCRPSPIRPVGSLHMPTGPMEKCTVQKLSYQPICCVRTLPIKPHENNIKPSGPLHCMTTQKHDFVPKPHSRRLPIRPISWICRPTGIMEHSTVNKLSYMPVNVCEYPRPEPIRPRPGVARNSEPMEKCTTYKLSYLANCIQPKEPMPWSRYSTYVRPTAPMEKCTIQKLSYGPPGTFTRCGCCGPTHGGVMAASYQPKAGICN